MALSDSCFDFTQQIVTAARELLAAVDWYADEPYDYGAEVLALRKACRNVQQQPWNSDAAVVLIQLTTSVMRYHDTPPGSPDVEKRHIEMQCLIGILAPSLDESLSNELKRLLPDVVQDTPRTERAANRLKTILAGIGKATYDVAIKVVSDIATETAKKILGLKP